MCAFNISYCVEVVFLVLRMNACNMCDCLNDELLNMVQFGDQYLVSPQTCTLDIQMNDVYHTCLFEWCIIGLGKMSKIKCWSDNEFATLIFEWMMYTIFDWSNDTIVKAMLSLVPCLLRNSGSEVALSSCIIIFAALVLDKQNANWV